MNKILWGLRISLSNFLDRFQWYCKFLGGDWYLVQFHMQTHRLSFWVRRYDDDDLDSLCDRRRLNPYIDILEVEKYD